MVRVQTAATNCSKAPRLVWTAFLDFIRRRLSRSIALAVQWDEPLLTLLGPQYAMDALAEDTKERQTELCAKNVVKEKQPQRRSSALNVCQVSTRPEHLPRAQIALWEDMVTELLVI